VYGNKKKYENVQPNKRKAFITLEHAKALIVSLIGSFMIFHWDEYIFLNCEGFFISILNSIQPFDT
jgi:hypothetical protein